MAPKTTWRQFVDTDPYYALLGEVQEVKVFDEETNAVHIEILEEYCERLFMRGWVKHPREWIGIWAAMLIPVEIQAEVLEVVLKYAISNRPEGIGQMLFELLRGMRVKAPAVQKAVAAAYKGKDGTGGQITRMLFLTYPKSPYSKWGWGRVGWGWATWWMLVEASLNGLEPVAAFDELAALLDLLELKGKMALSKQELWQSQNRLAKARKLLCRYGSIEEEDLAACIDATLN
eukprot:TRINITY_DN61785_c0_g1_i1.p1 TRINITY_DN61785_c0_g1~~TRINITY_DN61785_c0_g1_i1.p1  ORF type:complete len:232 (-),score=58.19 TRINITY_DN61785_c0_g1_i1:56-751(-)